jgi:hypothetical protein
VSDPTAVDPVLHGRRLRPLLEANQQELRVLAQPATANVSPAAAMRFTIADLSSQPCSSA